MPVDLAQVESLVASLLRSADPDTALAHAKSDPDLTPELRAILDHVQPDGLTIASLLVARLRFERLMQGSAVAIQWFESDPADFAAAFKRYHTTTASEFLMPTEEAVTFEAWVRRDRRV
ncbi:MAG: hypothetical protein KDB61_11405 [Planctomycetes bacterium]|nr:hypothetical protein [Planctomycetota bacterium]